MQWRLSKHKGFQWKLPDKSLLRSKLIYLAREFPWPYFTRPRDIRQSTNRLTNSLNWLIVYPTSVIHSVSQSVSQSVRQSVIRSFVRSVRHFIHAASLPPGSLGNLLREFVRKPTNTYSFTHSFIELYNVFIHFHALIQWLFILFFHYGNSWELAVLVRRKASFYAK